MKLVRYVQPIAQWKESRVIVREHRRISSFYGWLQFRLFLYVAAGAWGSCEIARLNPESPLHHSSILARILFGILFAVVVIYGSPFIARVAPSMVRLYPNFICVTYGIVFYRCFPFPIIAQYQFEKTEPGWILHLSDILGHQALVAVPTDNAKAQTESALSAAKVPTDGGAPEVITLTREVYEKFRAAAKASREAVRKRKSDFFPQYLAFCAGCLIFSLGLLYLQFRHTISNTVSAVLSFVMPALFFSALFGMAAVENRTLKKFVRDAGLTCRQCGKALIRGTSNIPSYEQTLSCPYCGTSLIRSASA